MTKTDFPTSPTGERINFPDYPEDGKIYSIGDVFWKYNGSGWVRQLVNYTPNPRMNDAVSIFQTEHDFLIHYMDISAGIKRGDVAVVLETKSTYKNINGTHSIDANEIPDHWVKFIVKCSDSEGAGKVNVITASDDGSYPTDSPEYDWPRDGWRRGIIVVSEDWNASFICIKDNFDKFIITDKDFNTKWVELDARKDIITLVPDENTLLGLKEHDIFHSDGSITNIFTDPCDPNYIGEDGCKRDTIAQGHIVVVENDGKAFQSKMGGNGDIQEWQEILAAGSSEVFVTENHKVEYPKPYGWHKGSIVIDAVPDTHMSYIKIGEYGRKEDFNNDGGKDFINNWAELLAYENKLYKGNFAEMHKLRKIRNGDVFFASDTDEIYKYFENKFWQKMGSFDSILKHTTLAQLYNNILAKKGDIAIIEEESATYQCIRHSNTGTKTIKGDWVEISKMDRVFEVTTEIEMLNLTNIRQGDIVAIAKDVVYKNKTGNNVTVADDWQEIRGTSSILEYSASTVVDYTTSVHTYTSKVNLPPSITIHEDVNDKDWTGHEYAKGKCIFIDTNHVVYFTNDKSRMFKWIGDKPVLIGNLGETYTDTSVHPAVTYTAEALVEADFLLVGNVANDDTTLEFTTEIEFIEYYRDHIGYTLKVGDIAIVKGTGKSYKNVTGKPAADHDDIVNQWKELISAPTVVQFDNIPEFGDINLQFNYNKSYKEVEQVGTSTFKIDPTEMKVGVEITISYITYRKYPMLQKYIFPANRTAPNSDIPDSAWIPQPGLPNITWDNSDLSLQFKNIPKMEYDTKYYLRLTSLSDETSVIKEVLVDVVGFESPPIP